MNQRNDARDMGYRDPLGPENFTLNIYQDANVYMPPTTTQDAKPAAGRSRRDRR